MSCDTLVGGQSLEGLLSSALVRVLSTVDCQMRSLPERNRPCQKPQSLGGVSNAPDARMASAKERDVETQAETHAHLRELVARLTVLSFPQPQIYLPNTVCPRPVRPRFRHRFSSIFGRRRAGRVAVRCTCCNKRATRAREACSGCPLSFDKMPEARFYLDRAPESLPSVCRVLSRERV